MTKECPNELNGICLVAELHAVSTQHAAKILDRAKRNPEAYAILLGEMAALKHEKWASAHPAEALEDRRRMARLLGLGLRELQPRLNHQF